MKLRRALESGARRIAAGLGIELEEARFEARVLLGLALGRDRAWIAAHLDSALPDESAYDAAVGRRECGEPVAYIVGEREFYGRRFRVTPEVLIPRPETELIVEFALAEIGPDVPARILDLGTGSGAIAISIALEREQAEVIAVDASTKALAVARQNAAHLGTRNVRFVAGNWFGALESADRFDLIVANPPYVADDDAHLCRGDLRFEPQLALAGGRDGLAAIREIARAAPSFLRPHGALLIEHGWNQRDAVAAILGAVGFRDIRCHPDLAGLDRLTRCRFS